MYAAFAVLYGVCETVNGNWAQLDMTISFCQAELTSVAATIAGGVIACYQLG